MTPMFLTGNPNVDFLPDGVNVLLGSEIRFRDSRGRLWIAPAGKQSDGASIPRILWPWLGGPYNGFFRDAALLHDEAYGEAPAMQTTFWTSDLSLEREDADRMIWEATMCRINGAKLGWISRHHEIAKANAVYDGLRAGGWL